MWTKAVSAASWGLRPRRLLRAYGAPPGPSALPPGIPQGFALIVAPKGLFVPPPAKAKQKTGPQHVDGC
jgi:hypothetical protein